MSDDASPSKRGSGSETRREEKPSKMTGFFRWLGGLVSNPATGKISHTKGMTDLKYGFIFIF